MACKQHTRYPIGTPGQPWGDSERQTWLAGRRRVCDYFETIVSPLHRIPKAVGGELVEYGAIDYRPLGSALFPLFAFRSAAWDATLPMAVITGGVHGYELGSLGAIEFIAQHFQTFVAQNSVNLLLLPCVAPWGLEMCERWTPMAVDPNRAFKPDGQSEEAALAMKCIAEHRARSKFLLLHMDLHETTDTDNTEFTPARFARDGLTEDKYEEWYDIPDGFYIYGDSAREKDQLEFSKHIIAAVEKVTHIAAADDRGKIVGEPVAAPGVLLAPGEGTADAHTDAMYVTTTEVYPDSQRTSREECNRAQAAAIVAGLEFALAHQD